MPFLPVAPLVTSPSGPAGGGLAGTYPNPAVAPPLALTQAAGGGGILAVQNTTAAPTSPSTQFLSAAAADTAIGVTVTGDAHNRLSVQSQGNLLWSNGTNAPDITAGRLGVSLWGLSAGSFDVSAAGQGLRVAEGANAKQGTAVLVAGSVVVANTSVTANSRILLTSNADGGTPGFLRVSARVAGTSFTITSSNVADTSTVAYQIFEPG